LLPGPDKALAGAGIAAGGSGVPGDGINASR